MPTVKVETRLRPLRGRGRTRLLIADHQRMFTDALQAVFAAHDYQVVGVVENGRRAVKLARDRRIDLALLDASMPIMNGVEAARHILRSPRGPGVVLLTEYGDDDLVPKALHLGVRGIVVKAQSLEDLLEAMRHVREGAIYISPCYSAVVQAACTPVPTRDEKDLTGREIQMLRLITEGKTMKQAAAVMATSVRTAEWHRASVMEKLGLHDTASLVRYAIRRGLIVA